MTTIDSIYNVFGITAPFEKIGKLLFSETYLKMECWDGKVLKRLQDHGKNRFAHWMTQISPP